MKNLILLLLFLTLAISCKTETKEKKAKEETTQQVVKAPKYSEALGKVFKKHGGIEAWQKAKTLSYKLKDERHTVDLHSRKTLVATNNYSLGFDGKEVWLAQQDSTAFKKDPKFYYNLFFYFYAMPFVLADDGIIYEDVAPFVYEDVSYPGIKISYKANVGTSPDDNYFIYYNPETFQMEWLGYTVTYRSKKPSDNVKMIRYDNWEDVNGFLLPKSITWYKKDEKDKVLKPAGKELTFLAAKVTETAMADDFYNKQSK